MKITRIIDGIERKIELNSEEIIVAVKEFERMNAYDDLENFLSEEKAGIVLTDEQKRKIVEKYLDYMDDDDGWNDNIENAYDHVMNEVQEE